MSRIAKGRSQFGQFNPDSAALFDARMNSCVLVIFAIREITVGSNSNVETQAPGGAHPI
jgi:hypothetical protein